MRPTGGEGFVFAPSRGNPQDGGENLSIRKEDPREREHSEDNSHKIHHYVIDKGVRAGKFQNFRKITKNVGAL